MRSLVFASLVLGVLSLTGGATPASAQPLSVSIGANLPQGMTVYVTVGGDGANCTGAGSAVVGEGGRVSLSIELRCDPNVRPTTPNDKSVVRARGLDERSNTSYAGSGSITVTNAGSYRAAFSIDKV